VIIFKRIEIFILISDRGSILFFSISQRQQCTTKKCPAISFALPRRHFARLPARLAMRPAGRGLFAGLYGLSIPQSPAEHDLETSADKPLQSSDMRLRFFTCAPASGHSIAGKYCGTPKTRLGAA